MTNKAALPKPPPGYKYYYPDGEPELMQEAVAVDASGFMAVDDKHEGRSNSKTESNTRREGEWLVVIQGSGDCSGANDSYSGERPHHIRCNSEQTADEIAAWFVKRSNCSAKVFRDPFAETSRPESLNTAR
jgi:hypothetical protein